MPINYLIIAGAQAAGKSTLINSLCHTDKTIVAFQESRQLVVRRHKRLGAIFMTRDDEIEVISHDMQRMFGVLYEGSADRSYVDETNVFTLSHAWAHGIKLVDGFYKQYCDMLERLNAGVLFVDVPPDVSWARRRPRYVERVSHYAPETQNKLLSEYHEYLTRLNPKLLEIYDRLEVPKRRIDGCLPSGILLKQAQNAVRELGFERADRVSSCDNR